ncbi:MAG: mannonate dehydratase [Clostridium sp.]|jgi:mannonate dehydratase|nr:mannonate dehydratase [Clostridium sp.]
MVKMTFRWFGSGDPVGLEKIRQIPGISGVVSAVYGVPVGEAWSEEAIAELKAQVESAGLELEVIESVPVHEEIKLGGKMAPQLIENYCTSLRRLGKAGVKVVCYNFMPVFDWLRSTLALALPDGSNALAYDHEQVLAMNPRGGGLSLPGWDESYKNEELQELLCRYEAVGEEELWANLAAFLRGVIPAAEEAGIRMAIHPDDPPWGIFGLPRVITGKAGIERLFGIYDSPANGLTLCTGSLGADGNNDLAAMAAAWAKRIPFAHLRNISRTGERRFAEAPHPSCCGSLDIYAIARALVENGFNGHVRPDHGRMIWGETGRPGYGLYDRALGACYLNGLFEALERSEK